MEEKYIAKLKLAFPSSLQMNVDNIAEIIIALSSRYQAIGVVSNNRKMIPNNN